MIARIRGEVVEKAEGSVIVDVQGLGYEVLVSARDLDRLQTGQPVQLMTYDYLRENTHDLFGFTDSGAKRLFEQLLSVSGVGPKMAIALLGLGSTDEIRGAIASGNTAYLSGAPGVGKRLAERITVDLKDKVGPGTAFDIGGIRAPVPAGDDAHEALLSLGYSASQAQQALARVPQDLGVEARIKEALKELAG